METVSLKIDKNLMNKMDSNLTKHNYSTRTEFIREAIRDKIKSLDKNDLIMKMYGASKRKTTDRQLHEVGEKVFRELEKKFS